MAKKVILIALRVALAWTFFYAGILKIWDFRHGQSATPDFTIAIQQYHLLPYPELSVLLAVYLPWLEVTAALTLFFRRFALGSLTTILGMTAVFLAALSSAWARGLQLSCGCFGKDEVSTDYPSLLLRDVCIFAAALFLLILEARRARNGAAHTPLVSPEP